LHSRVFIVQFHCEIFCLAVLLDIFIYI